MRVYERYKEGAYILHIQVVAKKPFWYHFNFEFLVLKI